MKVGTNADTSAELRDCIDTPKSYLDFFITADPVIVAEDDESDTSDSGAIATFSHRI